MAQFIRLTLNTGISVYVNMNLVRDILQSEEENLTIISNDSNDSYKVRETPQEIFNKLENGETNLDSLLNLSNNNN